MQETDFDILRKWVCIGTRLCSSTLDILWKTQFTQFYWMNFESECLCLSRILLFSDAPQRMLYTRKRISAMTKTSKLHHLLTRRFASWVTLDWKTGNCWLFCGTIITTVNVPFMEQQQSIKFSVEVTFHDFLNQQFGIIYDDVRRLINGFICFWLLIRWTVVSLLQQLRSSLTACHLCLGRCTCTIL